MTRAPDHAWEALVRVTDANEAAERGRLNIALKAIRIGWEKEGGLPEDLPEEIARRAVAYRKMWPTMSLTPTALAVHWHRVMAQAQPKSREQQALDDLRKEK